MSQFYVNGIEQAFPMSEERSFGDLLTYVHSTMNTDAALVSNIRVNGQDVSEREEFALSTTPISSIQRVEVLTVHPRELADETLQTLVPFTSHLEALSKQSAEKLGQAEPSSWITRLLEGLTTFNEAIGSAKDILGIGKTGPEIEPSHELELRLLEKLRELLYCQQRHEHGRMKELLAFEIPAVLAAWRELGLPALIRSRDS